MGKRRGKLRELGLKRVPRKFWVNQGFGNGYYCFRNPVQLESGEVVRFCESKDGSEIWPEPLISPTLEKMGLKRNEFGKIVKKV